MEKPVETVRDPEPGVPEDETLASLYRFCVGCTYQPLANRVYGAGTVDALTGWQPRHIRSALAVGIIEPVSRDAQGEERYGENRGA